MLDAARMQSRTAAPPPSMRTSTASMASLLGGNRAASRSPDRGRSASPNKEYETYGDQVEQAKFMLRGRLDEAEVDLAELLANPPEDTADGQTAARKILDSLGVTVSSIFGELSDAHQSLAKVQREAEKARIEERLNMQRRASRMETDHKLASVEALVHTRVATQVRSLVGADGQALFDAHKRIDELTNEKQVIQNELDFANDYIKQREEQPLDQEVARCHKMIDAELSELQLSGSPVAAQRTKSERTVGMIEERVGALVNESQRRRIERRDARDEMCEALVGVELAEELDFGELITTLIEHHNLIRATAATAAGLAEQRDELIERGAAVEADVAASKQLMHVAYRALMQLELADLQTEDLEPRFKGLIKVLKQLGIERHELNQQLEELQLKLQNAEADLQLHKGSNSEVRKHKNEVKRQKAMASKIQERLANAVSEMPSLAVDGQRAKLVSSEPPPLPEMIEMILDGHRATCKTIEGMQSELERASDALSELSERLAYANGDSDARVAQAQAKFKAERISLIRTALSSMQQLRLHLTQALSGVQVVSITRQNLTKALQLQGTRCWNPVKKCWDVKSYDAVDEMTLQVAVPAPPLSPKGLNRPASPKPLRPSSASTNQLTSFARHTGSLAERPFDTPLPVPHSRPQSAAGRMGTAHWRSSDSAAHLAASKSFRSLRAAGAG